MSAADEYVLNQRNIDNQNLASENRRLRARIAELERQVEAANIAFQASEAEVDWSANIR